MKIYNDKFLLEKEERKKHELKLWITYYQYIIDSLQNIKLILPNLTFEKKLTLRGSKSTVEIINAGIGHTANDIIMYVSEDNILFAGDLVFVKCHPYLASGYPDKWVNTLDRLKNLKIDSIIPGHGPIGKKIHIDLMIQYIADVREIASKIRKGDEATRRLTKSNIPPPYDTWRFGDMFFPLNIQFFIEKILT